ncbi:hypothetical protein Tsubulata_026303 [Turnera subulata]|uniref:Metallothionein-like protein n=1 Tax=Turnera subulata TaxID=218843 RepID=A0A9Q0GAX3_9ROSI|nr:hypothetical protein Tsubulata_026303 [Turnera subulata]
MSSGCNCGSDCKCGDSCKCGEYIETTTTQTIIAGVASTKMVYEMMSFGAENDCKCGSNCSCDSCNCK